MAPGNRSETAVDVERLSVSRHRDAGGRSLIGSTQDPGAMSRMDEMNDGIRFETKGESDFGPFNVALFVFPVTARCGSYRCHIAQGR